MSQQRTTSTIRKASSKDWGALADLLHFNLYVHRHLDFRPALEWLGYQPFYLLAQGNKIFAALACPPDPPQVAWIRLFAVAQEYPLHKAWKELWTHAMQEMQTEYLSIQFVGAIPLNQWFEAFLMESRFTLHHTIIFLQWQGTAIQEVKHPSLQLRTRSMSHEDMPSVEQVDRAAFPLLWQLSKEYLHYAMQQAAISDVALIGDRIVGYQITTSTQIGAHLARLAVHPDVQRQGIASALLHNLLQQLQERGITSLTVNTQEDNFASLQLYQKFGFTATGEKYPIYIYPLRSINPPHPFHLEKPL